MYTQLPNIHSDIMLFPCLANTEIQLRQYKCISCSVRVLYFSMFINITERLCISIEPIKKNTKDFYKP